MFKISMVFFGFVFLNNYVKNNLIKLDTNVRLSICISIEEPCVTVCVKAAVALCLNWRDVI